jgi:PAS domain S-box-containing protein
VKASHLERALILAPTGRDSDIAAGVLAEARVESVACESVDLLIAGLGRGAGFVLVTEEALLSSDLRALSAWIKAQPEWSDMPFVLLTHRGGGLERNPDAGRFLDTLGNVTFLERPFHPTTLVSLAQSALRGRRRQYDARGRLEELQESEDHFRHTVELNPQVAWTATPDGRVDQMAPRWLEWTGRTGIGSDVKSAIYPDDIGPSMAAWAHSIATGTPYNVETRVRMKDGGYRWMHSRAMPRRDKAGNIIKWYGTTEDIHDRKAIEEDLRQSRADLQRANETLEARVEERTREHESALAKLHEAQKLETLGQLTGGVAHDFNNLLTPVIGNLDLLRRRLPEGDKSHRLIDGALQAASRAGTLVQRLLAFARRQDLQPRAVEIGGLLDGMTDLLQRSIGPTVKVQFDSEPGLPPARVDPNQLELAILNLAINARDAMPSGGTLWIEARPERVDAAGRLQPGDYVGITVRDTGSGMSPETLTRAIEPFFSTKGVGQGTGLGLSMVHGLAAQLGGTLDIKSKLGKGTAATIWLPVSKETPVAAGGEEAAVTVARQAATIMLVDDEDLVRTGTADMLSDLGYEVVQASSGAEALRMLRSGVEVELMITDFLMPGMNGVALIEHATALARDMKVLLVTGYSTIAEGPGAHIPRLGKPYRQAELSRRVADLLSQHGGGDVVSFDQSKRPQKKRD